MDWPSVFFSLLGLIALAFACLAPARLIRWEIANEAWQRKDYRWVMLFMVLWIVAIACIPFVTTGPHERLSTLGLIALLLLVAATGVIAGRKIELGSEKGHQTLVTTEAIRSERD